MIILIDTISNATSAIIDDGDLAMIQKKTVIMKQPQ